MENCLSTSWPKKDCVAWLQQIGQSTSGTVEELRQRIRKFQRYPTLVRTLRDKVKKNYDFPTSLDPVLIPPPSANWRSDDVQYPVVTEDMFKNCMCAKLQGNSEQQQKAYMMLQSRKIASAKILKDNDNTFVKAMITKSYGHQIRPAVVLFQDRNLQSAYCICPIGTSGLFWQCFGFVAFFEALLCNWGEDA